MPNLWTSLLRFLLLLSCSACCHQGEILALQEGIIFDVSNLEKYQFLSTTDKGIDTKFHHSDLQYFSLEYINTIHSRDPEHWTENPDRDGYFNITGISILFKLDSDVQQTIDKLAIPSFNNVEAALRNEDNKIDALVFHVDPFYSPPNPVCRCDDFSSGLKYLFEEKFQKEIDSMTHDLKIGLKYDEGMIACCNTSIFSVFEKVDLAIFTFHVKPEKILLSANLFFENFRHKIRKNRQFVRSVNSYVNLYIQVVVDRTDEFNDSSAVHYRYLALIKNYLDTWLQTESLEEIFILETYPKNVEPVKRQIKNVVPILLEWKPKHHWEDFQSPCQMHYLLNTISNSFGDFILKLQSVNPFKALQAKCQEYPDVPIFRKNNLSNVNIILGDSDWNNDLREVIKLASMKDGLRFNTIFLKPYQLSLVSEVRKLLTSGVKVGCYVRHVDEVNECGALFNESSSALLIENVLLDRELDQYLPEELYGIHKEHIAFSKMYPEKELIPILIVTNDRSNNFWRRTMIRNTVRQTLFCDNTLQKLYEYYNAILTFFEIHQFTKIVLSSAIHRGFIDGWWNTIETLQTINRTATNFPVLVQRNLPTTLQTTLNLSNHFNCIEWLPSPNEQTDGTKFKENSNFGGFIDQSALNISLSDNEAQTLLLFAFSKFSFLEIMATDHYKMPLSITSELGTAIFSSHLDQEFTYLVEVPFNNLMSSYISHAQIRKIFQTSLGFHVIGWEYGSETEYSEVIQLLEENFKTTSKNYTGHKFGITISSCLDEVNSQFVNIRTSKILKYASYVVCVLPPITTDNNNQDKMQMFLDTNFYIKTYFSNFLPLQNIRLYFRLQFSKEKCEGTAIETANYLKTINDLNEHSKIYGLRYIINLFDPTKKPDCPYSWWRIVDNNALSNLTTYVEREADFFGRETELILKLNKTLNTETTDSVVGSMQLYMVTFGSLALLLISLSFVVVLWYRFKTMRQKYLTSDELDIFRNGSKLENDQEISNLVEALKFDSSYEIERDDIQLRKCIGTGRFGQVFMASMLNDNSEVAVKLPKNECLKESFLSMLTEVKIHCYVGSHPFVIAFIGACTQEVRKGKLYIVTEYCENGSLLNYLNALKSTHQNKPDLCVNMYQFCLFSYQIATGMVYISEKNIVHGDLSTRNVLINADLICKIGDFGLSRRLYENTEYVKKTKEPLPWRWLAIESLKNRTFTTMSDVWSYGVTIWEIFTLGELPYPSKDFTDEFIQEVENGLRLPKAQYSSEDIHDKLICCWSTNPQSRPKFKDLSEFFAFLGRAEYEI